MTQANSQLLTFETFLEWKPEDRRYELYAGIPIEIQPGGKHEEIVEFLDTELTIESRRLQLPYRFPKQAIVKPPGRESGYIPDIMVLDRRALAEEPLWAKYSTITQGSSVPLVVEVVSTNWRNDYGYKLTDYEAMGIREYWIVDYLALGGRRYIGFPKVPTLSIYTLVEGEYKVQLLRASDRVTSLLFPDLTLSVEQIFNAGG